MRRPELIVLAIATAGCNAVLGIERTISSDAAPSTDGPPPEPDLDRDGTLDVDDPCIATLTDSKLDSDGDARDNADDDCPFDATEGADADGDGIQDACDPFPASGGDRIRCVMALSNPGLNARLWRAAPGDMAWSFGGPGLYTAAGGGIVATAAIDAPVSTSFDVYGTLSIGGGGSGSATLWLRTDVTPSPSDVGCEVRADATSVTLSIVHGGPPIVEPVARAFGGAIRMRATLEPGASGTTVRCELAYTTFMPLIVPVLTGSVVIPPGRIGFSAVTAGLGIYGITVMERSTPAL